MDSGEVDYRSGGVLEISLGVLMFFLHSSNATESKLILLSSAKKQHFKYTGE